MPGITITESLPRFVSQEQHQELTSSTPASFAELPTVLYHEEKHVSMVLDPPLDGFSEEDCASGTVYILSR
jgi:nucleotide-sensitive chloride channel 1A